jgi:hypothetical protein
VFAAGTTVRLLTRIGEHPAGTPAVVVYDLGEDQCEIVLETGEHLTMDCAALAAVDEVTAT